MSGRVGCVASMKTAPPCFFDRLLMKQTSLFSVSSKEPEQIAPPLPRQLLSLNDMLPTLPRKEQWLPAMAPPLIWAKFSRNWMESLFLEKEQIEFMAPPVWAVFLWKKFLQNCFQNRFYPSYCKGLLLSLLDCFQKSYLDHCL